MPIVRNLSTSDLKSFIEFTDNEIGKGYFSIDRAKELISKAWVNNICTSLVLEDDEQIKGIRLAFAPGQWRLSHPSQSVHPELWKTKLSETGYFQSQFLHQDYQAQGWGGRLSQIAAERIKSVGAKAVVCHSWNESPNDSSRKYLLRVGFEPVVEIKNFWNKIDYSCTRCGNPCVCTATEMIKYL